MNDAPRIAIQVRWSDVDANGHVRHSAFFDYGAAARVDYLHRCGYTVERFHRDRIGPVLFGESAQYLRELHSNDLISVDTWIAGLSENRKHWLMRHHIVRGDGELCCVLDCRGAWFDADTRRVIPMPDELAAVIGDLPRTEDFQVLVGKG